MSNNAFTSIFTLIGSNNIASVIYGFVSGFLVCLLILLFSREHKYEGVIEVDNSSKDKQKWLFVLTKPPEDILKKSHITVLIRDVTQIVRDKQIQYQDYMDDDAEK